MMTKKLIHNDLTDKYSKGTVLIHWLTTLLILALFPMGNYMSDLDPVAKMDLIKIHALLGVLVFLLTLGRSYLFFKSKRPADLKTGSKFNDKLAIWIHNAFYFLLIGISIAGLVALFVGGYVEALRTGNSDVILSKEQIAPLKAHGLLATIMMILLVLHVLGVVKHYVLTKENSLKRIS